MWAGVPVSALLNLTPTESAHHSGLEWISTLAGYEPRWTREPSLSVITTLVRQHLSLKSSAHCSVTFFAQGGFNKLYSVVVDNASYMMRIALPVEPMYKTLSEVATLTLVRRQCTLLVPHVIAFDAQEKGEINELGFEWMLMQRMPGTVLEEAWKGMPWAAKEELVKQIVVVLAKLFRQRFAQIGNILPLNSCSTHSTLSEEWVVGRIVSMPFFWHTRSTYNIPHGPFISSHDWLHARLSLVLADAAHTLATSDDEDDVEDAEDVRALAERLIKLLPHLFSSKDTREVTALCHDDLSWHNLLVADNQLSGMIDWECVSVLPLWKVCQYPAFLDGRARMNAPDRTKYRTVNEDGEPDGLFDEHTREWETTQLRALFDTEMQKVDPDWCEVYRTSRRMADFELAVQSCDGLFGKVVGKWLDEIETGKEGWSLKDQLLQ